MENQKSIVVVLSVLLLIFMGTTGYFGYQYLSNNDVVNKDQDRNVDLIVEEEDDQDANTTQVTTDTAVDESVTGTEAEDTSEQTQQLTVEMKNGTITGRSTSGGRNYIEFVSDGTKRSYEVAEEAYILLSECGAGTTNEWHGYYTFAQFLNVDLDNLSLCFGESANGYQIVVVNNEIVTMLKNGISVP